MNMLSVDRKDLNVGERIVVDWYMDVVYGFKHCFRTFSTQASILFLVSDTTVRALFRKKIHQT